uniref:Uncharacterized protein n=1 Tax=Arundo donax TaxID=35708 RepID=A0A0A9M8Z6_ARUDO
MDSASRNTLAAASAFLERP